MNNRRKVLLSMKINLGKEERNRWKDISIFLDIFDDIK